MSSLGLEREVVDEAVLARTILRFAETSTKLPRLSELADPTTIRTTVRSSPP